MTPPVWVLTLAYWLHMLATVVWIGALATLVILVLPTAQRSLEPKPYSDFLGQIQRRLDPIGWFCLLLLTGTGLVQMSANPNYQGFLAIDNRWGVAILTKHVVFLVMVGLSAYLTWGLLPQTRRLALRRARGLEDKDDQEYKILLKKETWLVNLNLVLGVAILALTAIARAS